MGSRKLADLKPWPCSSGAAMVGRKSSMLLTAFCMTPSNTQSSGRHSCSISLVDEDGKYLRRKRAGWAPGACTSTCTGGRQRHSRSAAPDQGLQERLQRAGGQEEAGLARAPVCTYVHWRQQEPTWETR